jgi:hypothetical protein
VRDERSRRSEVRLNLSGAADDRTPRSPSKRAHHGLSTMYQGLRVGLCLTRYQPDGAVPLRLTRLRTYAAWVATSRAFASEFRKVIQQNS